MTEPAQESVGPYVVHDCLGMGRTGALYRIEHVELRRFLALRVLRPELCRIRKNIQRFLRDAVIASNLDHPNIVRVQDYGVLADGTTYLVTEIFYGRTLAQRLREGPIDLDEILSIALQLCDALRAAHGQGLVHRFLNPNSIFLEDDFFDRDRVKLLDFGIAKLWRKVQLPASIENSSYRSPEQRTRQVADPRSDIYALGMVLRKMCGQRSVPRHLRRAIRRCIANNPNRRFATAADLQVELIKVRDDRARSQADPGPKRAPGSSWRGLMALLFLISGGMFAAVDSPQNEAPPITASSAAKLVQPDAATNQPRAEPTHGPRSSRAPKKRASTSRHATR